MGKSTLLKVIAGMEDASNGEAHPQGTRAIYPAGAPADETKTVKENIELPGDLLAKIARLTRPALRWAILDADLTRSWQRWASSRPRSTQPTAGTWTASSSGCTDALQCPDPDGSRHPSLVARNGRSPRSSASLIAPDLPLLTSPPNHLDAGVGALAREIPARLPWRRHGRHARPLLLDDVAEWILRG